MYEATLRYLRALKLGGIPYLMREVFSDEEMDEILNHMSLLATQKDSAWSDCFGSLMEIPEEVMEGVITVCAF